MIAGAMAAWLLCPVLGRAAPPPGVKRRPVRIQLNGGALQTIPGDERADVTVEEDKSATAQALIKDAPPGNAIPTGRRNRPDERLLIYYSSHGFTDYNINSRIYTGYITGTDTPACHGYTRLSRNQLRRRDSECRSFQRR
jgi:hypothetical protein